MLELHFAYDDIYLLKILENLGTLVGSNILFIIKLIYL